MRIGLLVLISTLLVSGCAMLDRKSVQNTVQSPCGVEGYIQIPAGSVITGVSLPTDEPNKKYNIVTQVNGFWMSLPCHDLLEKGK